MHNCFYSLCSCFLSDVFCHPYGVLGGGVILPGVDYVQIAHVRQNLSELGSALTYSQFLHPCLCSDVPTGLIYSLCSFWDGWAAGMEQVRFTILEGMELKKKKNNCFF